jgi:hypothetical protein
LNSSKRKEKSLEKIGMKQSKAFQFYAKNDIFAISIQFVR